MSARRQRGPDRRLPIQVDVRDTVGTLVQGLQEQLQMDRGVKVLDDGPDSESRNLTLLRRNPLAEDVRNALSMYLSVTALTRARPGDVWTVRPLPSTNARSDSHRLFTVNVSNMETLYGYHNPVTGEDLGGQLLVWHELSTSLPRLQRDFEIDELYEVGYRTAQDTALAIYYLDLHELTRLLADQEIAGAAARVVTFIGTHGQVPGMQRRWHDPSFAAWISHNG